MTTLESSPVLKGTYEPAFELVASEYAKLLVSERDARGQFCAYADGRLVVDLWAGDDVDADDLQAVFSSTKGAAGMAIALLVERGLLDLDTPVARYWPEFGAGGKADVTVRLALSHQAGLPGVGAELPISERFNHDVVAPMLAAATPVWHPGTAHGYHGLTLGELTDELTRRVTGLPLHEFFRAEIAEPRQVDVHVRTPEELDGRIKALTPRAPTKEQLKSAANRGWSAENQLGEADSLRGLVLNVPPESLVECVEVRRSGQPAAAGNASARGLARMYATAISDVDGHPRLLSSATVEQVAQLQAAGDDLILLDHRRYAIVFQKPGGRIAVGSYQAFGHDGACGSIGVADPWHNVAWAWIPRRMSFPGGADPRGLLLGSVLRGCLADDRAALGSTAGRAA